MWNLDQNYYNLLGLAQQIFCLTFTSVFSLTLSHLKTGKRKQMLFISPGATYSSWQHLDGIGRRLLGAGMCGTAGAEGRVLYLGWVLKEC